MKPDPGIGQSLEKQTGVGKLAQFFPKTVRMRIPVRVATLRPCAAQLQENTLVEFGAADHAIFSSDLPLEFDDRVQLTPIRSEQARRKDEPAEAAVIAVQYHEGRKAVAVRFLAGRCSWVTQP